MRRFVLTCVTLCALVALARESARADAEFDKSRAVYGAQLRTISNATELAKSNALGIYRRGVEQARQQAKQAGDLDGLQRFDAELKRFDREQIPPAAPTDATLIKIAAASREASHQAELDGARKIMQLTDKYLAYLDQRVKQSVREERLTDAQACKTEMEAVKMTPLYQAAQFVLAEAQPADATPSASAPEPPATAPVTNALDDAKTRLRASPDGLYDAARIFEGTPVAALGAPSPYRALLSLETGRAPQTSGVGLTLEGYQEGVTRYLLRVKIRLKTAEPAQNIKLLAQYFTRAAAGGALQESAVQYAPIASVSAKTTTCEMKPIEFSSATSTYHTPRGDIIFTTGREASFVGVVVSAFSADDKLIAQVVSFPGLKDRGRTTFEAPANWR
jgi:hypothetical protein